MKPTTEKEQLQATGKHNHSEPHSTLHGLIILGRGREKSIFSLIHLWGDIPPSTQEGKL